MPTVHPENPVLRTYNVVRKPPEGLAYTPALAEPRRRQAVSASSLSSLVTVL